MKIAILTDSSYDGKLTDYKDLYMVPLMITEENGTQIEDDENFKKDTFYDLLDKEILKTTQSIPKTVMGMWDKLLKKYDQIIFAPLSKGLSGQFNTYRMMSETEDAYKGKVFVCDTNGVSIVLDREIEHIAMWIAKNKTGFDILELVKEDSTKFMSYIIPKDLRTLKKGGRVTPAAAALARMLKIVPVLTYDGIIDKGWTSRTFKKAIQECVKRMKKEIKGLKGIDITHSRTEPEHIALVEQIIKDEGLKIGMNTELTNVIVAHTGRDTFALVAWKEN